jgi:Nucleotidyl transferase AbiEii toxin, Type IV TA system
MAEINPSDPQSANEYDDRTTAAVKAVLLEIGQILGSFKGKFAVVGGAVPWLLLDNFEMPHVGTIDVDLGLDAEALGDGEYVRLVDALMTHGYGQNKKLKKFQLVRRIEATDEGDPIDIVVDFLMPRDAVIDRNKPPIIEDFAVQRADGTDLAMRFNQMVAVRGAMPNGGTNQVEIAVCSIPALLAMKGYAVHNRLKQKDAYDIYYCIRNYPEGIDALAKDCLPLLNLPSGATGYGFINEKFDVIDGFGPTCVKNFVQESKILGDRTPDQWQRDAFGQVDEWLRAIGVRA